jgi:glycosyltransferase involved in cell wall biosynthesis
MVEGLARGFSGLDTEDAFVFVGYEDAASWLDPLLHGPCRRVEVERSFGRSRRRRAYDALAKRVPSASRAIGVVGQRLGRLATPIAQSDGLLEALDVDVVHFVTPQAYLTTVPSVYQVMDLLHEHLPEFFSPLHRRYREVAYRAFSEQAAMLSTMAAWTRADISSRMGVSLSKIAVVPLPPAVTPETVSQPVAPALASIPDGFVLYPAQTWPHKNHLMLIEAIALLRDEGAAVHLVSTGRMTNDFRTVRLRIDELRLADHVTFLGYVDQAELAWLYSRASAMVFPSRFEGWGIPVVEAFSWGLPVACSDLPVLSEAAGHAALRFDPTDKASIAAAVRRILQDDDLRRELIEAGHRRLEGLTWEHAARTFQALYRRAAGFDPSDEDREVLAPPTTVA